MNNPSIAGGQPSSLPWQPLSARAALGSNPGLREPRLLGNWLLWLEQRPHEQGRTTALLRPWARPDLPAQELTPAPINLRSRVHDYGGGALSATIDGDQLCLAWIDDQDGCLWTRRWRGLQHSGSDSDRWLQPLGSAMRLSRPGGPPLADGLIDLKRQRWLGVIEAEGRDRLVGFALNQVEQAATTLHQPDDFAGYLTLNANADQLAWVEWQQPCMPWDASQLWWARLDDEGACIQPTCLAGSSAKAAKKISVFQPQWLADQTLLVAEDSSGWWNLMVTGPELCPENPSWRRPWPMQAETGMPQWVYGMSTTGGDGEHLLAAICDRGRWQLKRLLPDGEVLDLPQPFDDLAGLRVQGGRAVAIAGNHSTAAGLLELDLNSETWWHTPAAETALDPQAISRPESLWFEGWQGQATQAWYYPPSNQPSDHGQSPVSSRDRNQAAAPLLVKSHSGPTSMAKRGLNLAIQFWTSRGWGVVDVNYGGSTGFGRSYRERLHEGWGLVDVHDCAAAARALIRSGQADPQRIAIEGGSAGGFTTLACLCFTDLFRAGACRYAVSDLTAMAEDTHRFEARYLDGLVGAWPQQRQRYEQRSPLLHANRINCPVIFFQGLQDRVVPPQQTERMAAALSKNNIPVELHTFENEGHGFRNSEVQIEVLEATERFFRTHLKL
ncbi:MAG: alpha/beta hydrolase family protein [Prochlorococcus sp.]